MKPIQIRAFQTALAATLASLAVQAPAQTEEKVLNIYNWSDYIGEDTIRHFEAQTGIKVRYDNYDNNEILHAKLVAGKSGYDIVVPSSHWAKLQLDGGLLARLDKGKLPNLKNADPAMLASLSKLDAGNQYLTVWLWGYTTVGINVDKVKAALGSTPMPDNVWDLVFKPEYMSKLKSCGVSFLDSPSEILPPTLKYLGRNPYSRQPGDYNAAGELLKSIRPYVTLFSSSGYINDLANGSVCVSLGWSGDINIARRRAIEGKTGQHIEALMPKAGATLFIDTLAIPADAPHPDNAHKFINFVLDPQNAAGVTAKVFYPNGVPASKQYLSADIASNPTVFLSESDLQRMTVPEPLNNDLRRLMTRVYTSFKTGL
ncbi:polyamine ABC transporter substrate-binding protein [Aquincola tertiaricarbonis]|uniref:Putrescine-binding periplasmic protein n=1 Tax=Aquincola tertiaricarbonis TaxID=391953 RepID=A0ABY4S513_AQUTE|nr:polyamine ABC transporter substrate-binding protein [Aquincola tertiaricarbonis]URI07320.1 polyamine ABC transporter substrate-binding protein [Aquincola tertiaricarbonis]